MIAPEILQRIREIEIRTRRLLTGALVGDNQSAVKGAGFEFDQIREYHLGDDVRFIDWKSSARASTLLIKQYIEERSKTIIIALDVSHSTLFTSGAQSRRMIMAEIGSLLALVATYGKDRVGMILFSQEIELFIPPHKGMGHARLLMEQMFSYVPRKAQTSLTVVADYLASLRMRDAIVCIISDFIDDHNFQRSLSYVAKKHDVVAVRCLDDNEQAFPAVGFITVEDPETGREYLLDARSRGKQKIDAGLLQHMQVQAQTLRHCGVDLVDIRMGSQFIGDLVRFFRRRMAY